MFQYFINRQTKQKLVYIYYFQQRTYDKLQIYKQYIQFILLIFYYFIKMAIYQNYIIITMQCKIHQKQIKYIQYKHNQQSTNLYCSHCKTQFKNTLIFQICQQTLFNRVESYEHHLNILLKQIILLFNQFKNELFNNFEQTFNLIQAIKQKDSPPEIKQIKLSEFNLTFSPEIIFQSNQNFLTQKFYKKLSQQFKLEPKMQKNESNSRIHKEKDVSKLYLQNVQGRKQKNRRQSKCKKQGKNCCFY